MKYRHRLALILLVVFALGEGVASAEDRYLTAERVASRGRLLVRVGRIDEGIAAYREAYRLAPDPLYLLREAQALEQGDRLPEALAAYVRLLASADTETALPSIRGHVGEIRARLTESHGEVTIVVSPRAVGVYLDEMKPERQVVVPFSTWLPAGEHAVLVDEPGFEPTKVSFSVAAGGHPLRVQVPLTREQAEGTLIVRANRIQAAVYIDGVERCRTPCEQQLEPGTYLVRVEHPGDRPIQQLVRVRSSKTVPVDAMLRSGPSAIATTDFGDGTETGPGPGPGPLVPPPPTPTGRSRVLGTIGWVTLGVGAAAAAAGGVFNYLTYDKADEANALDPTRPDYDSRFSDLKSEVEQNALLTTILYAAGGALVAGGLTMVLIDAFTGDDGDDGEVIPIAPGPAPGGGFMLNARIRF